MGGNVLKKLRSSKGASITFALLAFLVCAVISAVLLASASAASGRASKLAETDQRYYAVTSAAQLFCDALEDKTTHTPKEFVIERVRTDTSVTQTKYTEIEGITFRYPVDPADLSKVPGVDSVQESLFELKMTIPDTLEASQPELIDSKIPSGSTSDGSAAKITALRDISIFTDAALSYVIGAADSTDVTVTQAYNKKPSSATAGSEAKPIKTWDLELSFAPAVEGGGYTGVPIKAAATLRSDGSMIIEFRNDSTDQAFKVTVTLAATVTDTSGLPEVTTTEDTYRKFNVLETEGEESVLYDYETTITTTKKTKTTTISWRVAEIKKGAA